MGSWIGVVCWGASSDDEDDSQALYSNDEYGSMLLNNIKDYNNINSLVDFHTIKYKGFNKFLKYHGKD